MKYSPPCRTVGGVGRKRVMSGGITGADFCPANNLILANTVFSKPDNKLATVRVIGKGIDAPIERGTHEQIDYVIIEKG